MQVQVWTYCATVLKVGLQFHILNELLAQRIQSTDQHTRVPIPSAIFSHCRLSEVPSSICQEQRKTLRITRLKAKCYLLQLSQVLDLVMQAFIYATVGFPPEYHRRNSNLA